MRSRETEATDSIKTDQSQAQEGSKDKRQECQVSFKTDPSQTIKAEI